MKREELQEEIDKASEVLKDFGKFKSLFSEDDGERTLAELLRTVLRIGMLLKASGLKDVAHGDNPVIKPGMHSEFLVKVRPCGEEYQGKTYLGIYIGDAALSVGWGLQEDGSIKVDHAGYNPAIFVPEFNRVVYGCESWWGTIDKPEDLSEITDKDIQNVWYVQALKAMSEKTKE